MNPKMNPLQKLVKMLADVFVPIIPALVASGLLMGLNNVLTAEGLFISGMQLQAQTAPGSEGCPDILELPCAVFSQ